MKISLQQLKRLEGVDKLIIHALDLSLFQASVVIEGQEYYIADAAGRLLRSHNKLELQALLQDVVAAKVVLRHQSAYDEMVGQPPRLGDNTLEVDLGNPDIGRQNTSESGQKLH